MGRPGGLDPTYSHAKEKVLETPYLEKVTFKPFGPVDNGRQHLYGLDYKTAMWRGSEDNPFHTEVGYWLWDGANDEVLRGFVVPRGITVLAGGHVPRRTRRVQPLGRLGGPQYPIGENQYLARNASTLSYKVTITTGDDTWSYDEVTMLSMKEMDEPFSHSDRNTLHRAG